MHQKHKKYVKNHELWGCIENSIFPCLKTKFVIGIYFKRKLCPWSKELILSRYKHYKSLKNMQKAFIGLHAYTENKEKMMQGVEGEIANNML